MIDLSRRSEKKELLDAGDIPFEDIKQNMNELDKINTLLGGHRITLSGMKAILDIPHSEQIHICEIGCGGGDNLMMLKKWCDKNKVNAIFTGIDIKKECIDFCREKFGRSANWICSDYKNVEFSRKPHILFSSLFCHHFTSKELQRMMSWMKENCTTGFFINDLHRHFLAYYSIMLLTKFFSRSHLVKNDAPLSVARGFSKNDWQEIFSTTGMNYSIQWKWAFRYLITFTHEPVTA